MRGLRDKLLTNEVELDVTKFIFALDEVARRLATSLDGELLIQVAFVEWCGMSKSVKSVSRKDSESANQQVSEPASLQDSKAEKTENLTEQVTESPMSLTSDAKEVWKQVLGSLGNNNLALDTILSKARPGNIHGDELTIFVQYDFHKQQLMSEKNLVKLEQIISQAVGTPMKVKCEVNANMSKTEPSNASTPTEQDGTIDDAMAIFTS